jgi:hypothetical protein
LQRKLNSEKMKKDIPDLKVEDIAIVVAPRDENDLSDELWDTFIINLKDEPITNVLIVSKGYGEDEAGEKRQTSTLRHFFEEIGPLMIHKIEPIQRELFNYTNEYWVSFTADGHMFDKKYIFVVGSIDAANFTLIPFLDRRGVMIR